MIDKTRESSSEHSSKRYPSIYGIANKAENVERTKGDDTAEKDSDKESSMLSAEQARILRRILFGKLVA